MAPKTTTPTDEPQVKIQVIGPEAGRWRGGFGTPRYFSAQMQEFDDLELSPEEIAELQADPELKVEIIPLAGAASDQPNP